jgi:hypothetical protein
MTNLDITPAGIKAALKGVTDGPWGVCHSNQWPWQISTGPFERISRAAYSGKAKTLQDVRDGVGFSGPEREEAAELVRQQEADLEFIAYARNNWDAIAERMAADQARITQLEAALAEAIKEHRVIAGMDIIAASSVAFNAARAAENVLNGGGT